MSHHYLILCALSALLFACNSEENPVDGEPGEPGQSFFKRLPVGSLKHFD